VATGSILHSAHNLEQLPQNGVLRSALTTVNPCDTVGVHGLDISIMRERRRDGALARRLRACNDANGGVCGDEGWCENGALCGLHGRGGKGGLGGPEQSQNSVEKKRGQKFDQVGLKWKSCDASRADRVRFFV
jgi:hypothetical protein